MKQYTETGEQIPTISGNKKAKDLQVILDGAVVVKFKGIHLGHEWDGKVRPNWHYYLTPQIRCNHFRKGKMVAVIEDGKVIAGSVPPEINVRASASPILVLALVSFGFCIAKLIG